MQAMIFAAGLGTRLYPITKDRPKALAELNGIPLLEHNIRFLAAQGVKHFVVNTHHFAPKVEAFLKEKDFSGLSVEISYEEELLDTAGGLAKAAHLFRKEDILLYNVDVVSNIDIRKMMDFHKRQNALASLAVRNRETSRYLLFDGEKRLRGWRNKNTGEEILCGTKNSSGLTEFAFSGIHIVSPQIFELLAEPVKKSLVPFYLEIAKESSVFAYPHNGDVWFDCGKPETLLQAASYLQTAK